MQPFKLGDIQEQKFAALSKSIIENIDLNKDLFFGGAYQNQVLGEVIFDAGASPLVNAIPRQVFIESFAAIFESFEFAGSLEGYLSIFKKIFGDNVEVTFTMPGPGKLGIAIVATGLHISNFITRQIVGNAYVFSNIKTHDNDFIVFRSIKGLESEYEATQMLFELVPGGIYTTISLSIGG